MTEGRRWTLLVVCLATGVPLLNVADLVGRQAVASREILLSRRSR